MEIRLLAIFLILILAQLAEETITVQRQHPDRVRKGYIALVCVMLIFQSGLRNVAVGPDTYAYSIDFDWVATWSWSDVWSNFRTVYVDQEGKDAGYPLFVKLFQVLTTDYRLFLFGVALLFFVALGRLIYYNTGNIREAMIAFVLYEAMFYPFYSITGIRQTLAVAFTLFGFECIKKRKFIPFLILVLVAFTFHKSALVFLLAYPLYRYRHTVWLYWTCFGLLPFLFLARNTIVYFLRDMADYGEYRMTVFPVTSMILYLVLSVWLFVYYRRIREQEPDVQPVYNLFSLTIVCVPLLGEDSLYTRLIMYFSIYILVLLPVVIRVFTGQDRKLYTIFILLLTVFLIVKTSNIGDYKFLWQEMKLGRNYF